MRITPLSKKCREGLHMLVLLHALIPCLVAYTCILHLFLYFVALSSLHPLTFNGNAFTPVIYGIHDSHLYHTNLLCSCV